MNTATKLYTDDEYICKNPTLHEENTSWKLSRIVPVVNYVLELIDKDEITLLDVGGGAGLVLRGVAEHIKSRGYKVRKIALDLSPGMLAVQCKNNPDLINFFNEDICSTSLKDKEIDIALMIDVIEHIPEPEKAILELQRIANFVIYKIPVEDYFVMKIRNFPNRQAYRYLEATFGHVNHLDQPSWVKMIGQGGKVIFCNYNNTFKMHLKRGDVPFPIRVYYRIGAFAYSTAPSIASKIFGDSITACVKT